MSQHPPNAIPIATDARQRLGERYRYIQAHTNALARKEPGWHHEVWLPANPADPGNVNAQGSNFWKPTSSSGVLRSFIYPVLAVPTLVLWHVMVRLHGCMEFSVRSPNFAPLQPVPANPNESPVMPSGDNQGGYGKFGTQGNSSDTADPNGGRFGQGRGAIGRGHAVPLSGTIYAFPMLQAGDFELSIYYTAGACPWGTTFVWDVNFYATSI